MQCHIFFVKCAKGNKMKKLLWKLIKYFFCKLPKCVTISLLISVFILIFIPTDKIYLFCFSHDWYLYIYTISLQVIFKICTIFASDWRNRQWFFRGLIKSKHWTLFPKWRIFCGWSPKYMIIVHQVGNVKKSFYGQNMNFSHSSYF